MLPAQDCLDYNPYLSVGEVAFARVEKSLFLVLYYSKGYYTVLLTHVSVQYPGCLHS
jgi:hypothetical protein